MIWQILPHELIGQYSIRIPTTIKRWTLQRATSSLDLLRLSLGQKDFATAQLLIVDERLLSWTEAQQCSSEPVEANKAPKYSHSEVIESDVPVLNQLISLAVSSNTAVVRHPDN